MRNDVEYHPPEVHQVRINDLASPPEVPDVRKMLETGHSGAPFANIWKMLVHPWRLTWNLIMEIWKIIFLPKWVICRFDVKLPGFIFFCVCECFSAGKLVYINRWFYGWLATGKREDWWCFFPWNIGTLVFPLSDVGSLNVARHQHAASRQITIGWKRNRSWMNRFNKNHGARVESGEVKSYPFFSWLKKQNIRNNDN